MVDYVVGIRGGSFVSDVNDDLFSLIFELVNDFKTFKGVQIE